MTRQQGLFDLLQLAVGEGKLDWGTFEHCGVKHVQSEDRKATKVTMEMLQKERNSISRRSGANSRVVATHTARVGS